MSKEKQNNERTPPKVDVSEGTNYQEPKRQFSKKLCIYSDLTVAYVLFLLPLWLGIVANVAKTTGNILDSSWMLYVYPPSFAFAMGTHIFYYNKEKFVNCIWTRLKAIKALIMFKKQSGLYPDAELQAQIDNAVSAQESEQETAITTAISAAEQEQEIPTIN